MEYKPLVFVILSVGILCWMSPTLAQEYQAHTLISGDVEHGGFAGPVVKFTEINDEFGVLVGGRGGWIIDHTFVIGGAGYGLVNDIEAMPSTLDWGMGYGGLELGYILRSHNLVHLSVQALIGAGGVGYRDKDHWDSWDGDEWDGDAFFVAEPGVNVILNVIENLRMGLGASYRYVNGVDEDEIDWTSDSDLSGPSMVLTLKLGIF
jgi:hypothetical protein